MREKNEHSNVKLTHVYVIAIENFMREKNEHGNVKLTHVYVITIENFALQVKTKT